MAKLHALFKKIVAQENIPLRQVIEKQRPSWFKHPNAIREPALAPGKVVFFPPEIIRTTAVFFPKIEWWISKNGINNFIPYGWKNFHAVGGKERAKVCLINSRWHGVRMEEMRQVTSVDRPPEMLLLQRVC